MLFRKANQRYQEQKKMRKQRRQAELQDKRDRIRMGLIHPDPPKGFAIGFYGYKP